MDWTLSIVISMSLVPCNLNTQLEQSNTFMRTNTGSVLIFLGQPVLQASKGPPSGIHRGTGRQVQVTVIARLYVSQNFIF